MRHKTILSILVAANACCFSEMGEAASDGTDESGSESSESSTSASASSFTTTSQGSDESTSGSTDEGESSDEASGSGSSESGEITDFALGFAGQSGGVAQDLPALPEAYTIEFNVRVDGGLHGSLISTRTGDPAKGFWFFQEMGDFTAFDNVLVFIDYTTPDWYYVVDPELDLNDKLGWRHVAATKDATGLVRLFVDGALVAERQFMTPFSPMPGPLWLGTDDVNSYPLHGAALDDLRISNVVRYDGPFSPPVDPQADDATLHLWSFDEGEGTEATDAVGGIVIDLSQPMWIPE